MKHFHKYRLTFFSLLAIMLIQFVAMTCYGLTAYLEHDTPAGIVTLVWVILYGTEIVLFRSFIRRIERHYENPLSH